MPKDANEVEIERQKSQMIRDGGTWNEINNPHKLSHHANTGEILGRDDKHSRGNSGYSNSSNQNLATGQSKNNGGGGNSGCFTSATNILTPSGWHSVSALERHDEVVCWNASANATTVQKVRKAIHHKPSRVWEINASGLHKPIETTWCHPFLTQKGWVAAWRLTQEHELQMVDASLQSKSTRIGSVVRTNRFEEVFNLHTDGARNFVADGAIVHSFAFLRVPRTALSRLAERLEPSIGDFAPEPII